jgi:hypothetical protein
MYFSCKVNNSEKSISLCGRFPPSIFDFDAPDFDTVVSQQAFLTYRFGTNQRIELAYPQKRTDSLTKFEGVSVHSMFGGSYEVYFRSGRYVYEVFAAGGEVMTYGVHIFDKNPFATPMTTVTCERGTAKESLPEVIQVLQSLGSAVVNHPANHFQP